MAAKSHTKTPTVTPNFTAHPRFLSTVTRYLEQVELSKQIKKLQRDRDQLKSWISDKSIKDRLRHCFLLTLWLPHADGLVAFLPSLRGAFLGQGGATHHI